MSRNKLGFVCLIVILKASFSQIAHSELEVDYYAQGTWPGLCNVGRQQSPIIINPLKAKICTNIGYFKFTMMPTDFPEVIVRADYQINAKNIAYAFFYDHRAKTYEAY